jgi:hypothetical protein
MMAKGAMTLISDTRRFGPAKFGCMRTTRRERTTRRHIQRRGSAAGDLHELLARCRQGRQAIKQAARVRMQGRAQDITDWSIFNDTTKVQDNDTISQ